MSFLVTAVTPRTEPEAPKPPEHCLLSRGCGGSQDSTDLAVSFIPGGKLFSGGSRVGGCEA